MLKKIDSVKENENIIQNHTKLFSTFFSCIITLVLYVILTCFILVFMFVQKLQK